MPMVSMVFLAIHYCKSDSEGYLVLYGSKAIANKLKKIEQSFYLYTINKGDHSWSGKPIEALTALVLADFWLLNKTRKI